MMSQMPACSSVTVGIIAYNEQKYLPDLLNDLLDQTYPKEKTEVVLVDSCSTDQTRRIMNDFYSRYCSVFYSIKVRDNSAMIQAAGWNVVIQSASCDVILRIDAHARLDRLFVENCIRCLNDGEFVCGGPRKNIIDDNTAWKRMRLDAEQALFGSGFAEYRRGTEERKYVNSVFHGAYRREVFENVGLFNEALVRTEDNELHYRIRQAGYRICYDPNIKSYYQTRNTLKRMLIQKYQNGFWIGKTLRICRGCISLFHIVPLVFVLFLLASCILAAFGLWQILALLGIVYGLFVTVSTCICLAESKNPYDMLLPIMFFLMHCSYGIGTFVGLLGI